MTIDYEVANDYDLSGKQYEVFDAAIDPVSNRAIFLYKNSSKEFQSKVAKGYNVVKAAVLYRTPYTNDVFITSRNAYALELRINSRANNSGAKKLVVVPIPVVNKTVEENPEVEDFRMWTVKELREAIVYNGLKTANEIKKANKNQLIKILENE